MSRWVILRSHEAYTVRRCQILVAGADAQKPAVIAKTLPCAPQTVWNVIHAFDARGLTCVPRGSNVPVSVEPVLNAEKREQVRAILHQSPRDLWPARACLDAPTAGQCLSRAGPERDPLSAPTMLDAIVRLGGSWKRAKHWIVRPDPAYERKKTTGPADTAGLHQSRHGSRLRR